MTKTYFFFLIAARFSLELVGLIGLACPDMCVSICALYLVSKIYSLD